MLANNFLLRCTLIFLCFLSFLNVQGQHLERVRHFGRNKGHLKMFLYKPANLDPQKKAPMVVVLHGCLQCAQTVGNQTGWNDLADRYGFYVLYPQQRILNNPERCFKWYKRKHIYKNRGENASIKKMVDFMKDHYSIDSGNVFITGLSAGAAMGSIMMADYPETFKAGAIFAGAPFKVATSSIPAAMAFFGWRVKTPEKWGSYVRRENPFYKGNYPKMIIYQGNNDWVVNPRNGRELMKQWTNVHGLGQDSGESIPSFLQLNDLHRTAYKDAQGKEQVIYYQVDGLSHALLVDPGNCPDQGGKRGFFSKDKDYNSTLWTAYDMGLLETPLIIGKNKVNAREEGLHFQVPAKEGCTYEWHFPADCSLLSTADGASIILRWGNQSGAVDVTEIDAMHCKHHFKTLWVTVQ